MKSLPMSGEGFDFLKSGSMVAGLTKAFLGVGGNGKELSFSDHTHNLPDLNGILTADKGGTGVSSLDELKTALGVSTNDYTMRFQVADYWQYSDYRIRVPMNVFGGIWFNDGISMLIRLRTPNQSRYYCYDITPDGTSSTEINDLPTVGNDYILNGIYGVFWYPA